MSSDSHISKENLLKYGKGSVFIETGTYMGHTVDLILSFDKYKTIHTIELNKDLYDKAVEKYKNEPRVKCWFGDSIHILPEIIKTLTEPATFWLDAHASGALPGGESGGSPIHEELWQIKKSITNEHTIIIDDCRLFGSSEWSYAQVQTALNILLRINSKYEFLYLDGHVPQDVLWAFTK